jgi:hypothetical protein
MKPSVGLTVLTSSPIIFFTMVVFPALSIPLHGNLIIFGQLRALESLQHQDSHLLVLQPCFSQNGQHFLLVKSCGQTLKDSDAASFLEANDKNFGHVTILTPLLSSWREVLIKKGDVERPGIFLRLIQA